MDTHTHLQYMVLIDRVELVLLLGLWAQEHLINAQPNLNTRTK